MYQLAAKAEGLAGKVKGGGGGDAGVQEDRAVAVMEISESQRSTAAVPPRGQRPRPGAIWSERGCQSISEGHQLGGPRLMHEGGTQIPSVPPRGISGMQEPDISQECQFDPRGSACACTTLGTLTVIVRGEGFCAGPRGRKG